MSDHVTRQNIALGILRLHIVRTIVSKKLRCIGELLFIAFLSMTVLRAGLSQSYGQTSPEQAVSEIENYIQEIQREESTADHILQSVSRTSSAPSSFYAQWVVTIAPRGAASLPIFANMRGVLTSWVTSIRNGSDRYPPLDEIRSQMSEWRGRVSRLKAALGRASGLEERRKKISDRLFGLKSESPEWQIQRAEENRINEEIRTVLSAAQSEAESSHKIPPPILPSDRTRSPFDGPVTPGLPTRLWIWTEKASTPIGDTINTQVGLANEAGPNCKADKSYSVNLDCDGCIINNPQITIQEGSSYSQTNIRVTKPNATVKASSKDLKRNEVNVNGCASAESIYLVITTLPDSPTRGPADGVTRLKYDLVFQDSKGQPATNALRKLISIRLDGVGIIEVDDQHSGAVRSAREGFLLPPGECVMHQAVFSDLVGQAIVQAEFQRAEAKPLKLIFDYAFPRLDVISMCIGALVGSLAYILSRKDIKKSWPRNAFFSLIGAAASVGIVYVTMLNVRPLPYTYLIAGLSALCGGCIGGFAMSKAWAKLIGGGSDSG
jgi:hypothetical protein